MAVKAGDSRHDDHAGRMDQMYMTQRHIYDLTRKYYLLGRDHAIRGLQAPPGARLLDLGCGTGRNLLLAHRLYPGTTLYGLDISREMLESARANFRGRAVAPAFSRGDASCWRPRDFEVENFDRILISYALSMIPEWECAIDAALAALAPRGSLHIVDFGQQDRLPEWFRHSLQAWLARFHVTPRANLHEALERRLDHADADMIFEEIGFGYAWHAVVRKRG